VLLFAAARRQTHKTLNGVDAIYFASVSGNEGRNGLFNRPKLFEMCEMNDASRPINKKAITPLYHKIGEDGSNLFSGVN
jgi:hypothetical protein